MTREGTHNSRSLTSHIQPWIEVALCVALAVLLFWKGILPAWRVLNTDFPNYYLVARLLREGYSLDRIYDWTWLQRIKDHWGLDQSLVGFAGLTPFSALPIVPLAIFSALTAKRIWIVANLVFLATSAELLHRSTSLGRCRVWILCLLAILPLRTSFLYGQMHLLVLFLLVLAYYFHRRNRELACGVCVALAGALKVYPLLFILYFLWKKQWRPAVAAVSAAILIIIMGSLWMGPGVLYTYATQALPRSLQGEVLDPYNVRSASGAALFHRLFLFEPALNPAPAFDSPALYAVLYPLWQLAIFLPLFALLRPSPIEPEREQMEWSAFLFALLVLSPVPSSYHFVVAILPVVLFVDALLRQNKRTVAVVVISLYFLMSVADLVASNPRIGGVPGTLLAFSRLWSGIALFALLLVCLYQYPSKVDRGTTLRPALLAMLAIVALITSITGYRRHFFHRQQEVAHRIPTPSTTYLATLPLPKDGGFDFVGMVPNGYRVLDQRGDEIASQTSTQEFGDQLSFAIARDNAVFLEVANDAGSRVVRDSDGKVVVEDAESPAISGDGNTLAFVREAKGHGSIWMTQLDHSQNDAAKDAAPNLPTRITGDEYDVRSVSLLNSGTLLFLAKHDGHARLFTATPRAAPVPFFSVNAEISSFAISPDEHLIAFTELIHHRWQLAVFSTLSRQTSVLTFGDCNAYTPAWSSATTIIYATDCGRGIGLSALASIDITSAFATHSEP